MDLYRVSEGSGIRSSYQQCLGESSEYSSCNPQSCTTSDAGHPEDFRLFQCSLYNNRTVRGHYVATWSPYQLGIIYITFKLNYIPYMELNII